jgi:sirohydrochlorin ferrochelatase
MPDERDVAQAKKAIEQNEKEGTIAEDIGKHPEHAPLVGKKTPQEHEDKDAIDESGNLLHPKEKDENDAT